MNAAINLNGVVQATGFGGESGAVEAMTSGDLVVNGRIEALGINNGDVGGTVVSLIVLLFGRGCGRCQWYAGGGEVLIGGNYLGQGPEPNARVAVLTEGAQVSANALAEGDGGRVIVWSDEYTGFYGSISALSAEGGLGGFVETSSKLNLQAQGTVNVPGGDWLLDPANVRITGVNANPAGFINPFIPNANDAQVNAADIVAALDGGTNVEIRTAGAGTQAGSITVVNAIGKTAGGAAVLTLNADANIDIDAAITSTSGTLGLNLNSGISDANGTVDIGANLTLNGGNLSVDTNGKNSAITQSAGIITALDADFQTGGGDITINNANNNFGGDVTAANTGGNTITIQDTNSITTGVITAGGGGSVALTAGDITVNGNITAGGITVTESGATGIGLGDTAVGGGLNITGTEFQRFVSSGTTELATGGGITVDNITAANSNNATSVVLDATGAIAFSNNASTFNVLTVESDNGIDVNVNVTTDVGAFALDADIDNANSAGDDRLDIANNVTLASATGLTLDATTSGITFAGAGTLNANNGVTINNAVTATAGTLTIDADLDNDGTGTFTNIAGATVNAAGQTLNITAGDVAIGAATNATTVNISDSDGGGIGLDRRQLVIQLSGAGFG